MLLLPWSLTARAHSPEEGDVHGTVGPYVYRTLTAYEPEKQAPYQGLGLVVEGDVDYNGGVEIAMFYLDKTYVRRGEEGTQAEHIKRVHVTTGYRHWFTSWISAALSFYSAYSMGDAQVFEGASPPEDEDRTNARRITEHGLDWSFQAEVWRWGDQAAVVDVRWNQSLTARRHERADVAGILLGFKSLIPKPKKGAKPPGG